ncbi:MAG: PstS family phosphate ABC transporter substrate-binding protein [Nitrospirae bacterium]|nr:PstS family phosphate ABC transporter substrate-binding protein [Nitrospirota bacterium]
MRRLNKLMVIPLLISLTTLFLNGIAAALPIIKIDGSSTVFPISEAVAEEFQKKKRGIQVAIGISGTGGGFKKFCNGEIDITDASRPIKPSEVDLCRKNKVEYIELPVAYDGITILVNPKNSWAKTMTVKELKKVWEPYAQGKIRKWNQIRPQWPDREIHLYGPGVDSGTYDYFTEAIVGKEHSSRGDYTSSEDDNVLVQGIATDEYALGFFGAAYYEQNRGRLNAVAVDDENPSNGNGPILPFFENIANGTYQPLARPLFIYVNKNSAGRQDVKEFIRFYLTAGRPLVKEVGYVPLQEGIYGLALNRFEKGVSGSVFGGKGSQVGLTLEKLLQSESK